MFFEILWNCAFKLSVAWLEQQICLCGFSGVDLWTSESSAAEVDLGWAAGFLIDSSPLFCVKDEIKHQGKKIQTRCWCEVKLVELRSEGWRLEPRLLLHHRSSQVASAAVNGWKCTCYSELCKQEKFWRNEINPLQDVGATAKEEKHLNSILLNNQLLLSNGII